ncbi:putative velvet factor [Septoria linicola]|nr:putative velvet factor [Septoria linicola]
MAQMQRTPSTFPPSSYLVKPEQRSSGPQLPPIQSLPPARSGFDQSGRPVQLPPMQLPFQGQTSPSGAPARSIPVAHLLSSPPSPPRGSQTFVSQPGSQYQSPASTYSPTPADYRSMPQSFTQLPPRHHLDQAPGPYRHSHQQSQHHPEQYQRMQHPSQAPVGSEYSGSQHYSPSMSAYSSPRSYTHSQASPRSSFAPSKPLASTPKPKVQPPPLNYNLSIRQQPAAARACGFGERDRRVIDPPPILELKITDANGLPEQDHNGMIALHCMLLNSDGFEDETELAPSHHDVPSTRRLMGTLVASPYQAKDENGTAGTFFVFPDLSCRSPGKYRLKFKLIRVDGTNMTCVTTHSSVISDVFNVYTAKDFPGMRASSSLLKALRRQGLNVGVKKGSEARKGKGKTKKSHGNSSSSEEGSDDSEGDGDSRSGSSPTTKSLGKKGKKRRVD